MFEEVSKNRRFGYARVSSQTQEDNSSLEAQKQEFIQKGVPEKNNNPHQKKNFDQEINKHTN